MNQMMTIEEAKLIVATYRMPLTATEMAKFKLAIALISGHFLRRQNG